MVSKYCSCMGVKTCYQCCNRPKRKTGTCECREAFNKYPIKAYLHNAPTDFCVSSAAMGCAFCNKICASSERCKCEKQLTHALVYPNRSNVIEQDNFKALLLSDKYYFALYCVGCEKFLAN